MNKSVKIQPLTQEKFKEAVELVLRAKLDTREEIEHHLEHLKAHYVALDNKKVIGVIGWYQDTMDYATKAMGEKFPGPEAYWVGFFAVDENYRGQGVGSALMRKLEEVLKKKKVKQLWVTSVPEARGYYERQGFKLVTTGKISGNPKYFLVKQLRKQ